MREVCIVGAGRTPFGRFLGSLSGLSAVDLAVRAGEAALGDVPAEAVDQVIVGNVLSAGVGMNLARQVGVRLQLPVTVPAWTINMVCGSGLQAIGQAAQAIRSGAADVVLCGGSESMSNAPHIVRQSRRGTKLGEGRLLDTVLCDGLIDAFSGEHMAHTAEWLARTYDISRQQQDEFALRSQQRYAAAQTAGRFDNELAPLGQLESDEHPRPDTSLDQLAALKPAFHSHGTITAGNASGLNDGAAMLVICSRQSAESRDWPVLAMIGASVVVGCDPAEMGLGPVHAVRRLCRDFDMTVDDFDTIEINEAFAAQTLACLQELKLNADRVNLCGGAIALGHPIGASGARLVAHLAHRIHSGDFCNGLATLCIGGGMGAALSLHHAT
jgi:acetyl-CoA C-acetyltransferase